MGELARKAKRGEPSYVWRAGQERRFSMLREAAGDRLRGRVLDNGCGVGQYLRQLAEYASPVCGLEFDADFARRARQQVTNVIRGAGEALPFPTGCFDLILSHEVLEHVHDDREALKEIVRVLRAGGRLVLFVPNRGYPFETHGVFWHNRYRFGNIPLINYLPRSLRDKLVPHVRVYTKSDLARLFDGLPVRMIEQRLIFGAYDNIIARWPRIGRALRRLLQGLENTPLRTLGLSHLWVVEKM